MRAVKTRQGLTLRAVAGSHVVSLDMSMKPGSCDGHMGFAMHRTDHTESDRQVPRHHERPVARVFRRHRPQPAASVLRRGRPGS